MRKELEGPVGRRVSEPRCVCPRWRGVSETGHSTGSAEQARTAPTTGLGHRVVPQPQVTRRPLLSTS